MSYEINLIEGERGKLHVTSDDARTENALMFGIGRKVLNIDNAFEASMTGNNTVRITSGVFYDNGMFIRVDRDKYVEVTIENGLPGTYRHDLICIRYERNIQTQLESASIIVKKGVASETEAIDPEYTEGDVLDLEVHLDEFPLYRVSLDGLTPTLEPMFVVEDVISNIVIHESLKEHIRDDKNPHEVTAEDVGLGNVDNTADKDKTVNHATTADAATKDSEGNVIHETYATNDFILANSNIYGLTGATYDPVTGMTNIQFTKPDMENEGYSGSYGGTIKFALKDATEVISEAIIALASAIGYIGLNKGIKLYTPYENSDEPYTKTEYTVKTDFASEMGVITNQMTDAIIELNNNKEDKIDKSLIHGTMVSSGTMPTATKALLGSIVLPKSGVYLIRYETRWGGNSNGVRMLDLIDTETSPPYELSAYSGSCAQLPPSDRAFVQNHTDIYHIQQDNFAMYLWGYHNAGSGVKFDGHNIVAIRLA